MNAPARPPQTEAHTGWHARLELGFEEQTRAGHATRTVLQHRKHVGPLCVQRPFYPDDDGTCHVYVLHPPGGIAGGDTLELDAQLAPRTRALLTTPAATKLYRGEGRHARVTQTLHVQDGALLRWLPQETIAFDGADARTETRIELHGSARAIAWEVLCLGRPASNERFTRGALHTTLSVYRDGKPLLIERAHYEGGSALLDGAHGLQGKPVLGTLICTYGEASEGDALVDAIRTALEPLASLRDCVAVSRLHGVVACRYLGTGIEPAQLAFRTALDVLTAHALGRAPAIPRIWLT